MAEYDVDHSTIIRLDVKYFPLLENKFTQRYKSQVGRRWRMDETLIKVKGEWHYMLHKGRVLFIFDEAIYSATGQIKNEIECAYAGLGYNN